MKKNEIAGLVVYLLMLALAIIIGIFVFRDAMGSYGPTNMHPMLFILIVIIVAVLFNVIMLEVLHVLGGLIGKYSISTFNVLGFGFYKKEKGVGFKFESPDGLTGETKLVPKEGKKLSLKPYIWLPLFGYAAELAGCIVLYNNITTNNISNNGWLAVCALVFIVISSMIALYNLVPIKLDSMTDGYRLVLISNPTNIEAYNELMRVEDLQRKGLEVGEIKVFDQITEFTVNLNLITAYKRLSEGKLDEAEKILDITLVDQGKLEPYTHYRLICQKLYIVIMTQSLEDAKKVYNELADDTARRFIANDVTMESIRAYILISGLLEKSIGEIKFALSKKPKAMKKVDKNLASIEEQLFENAYTKVLEVHPKWKEELERKTTEH